MTNKAKLYFQLQEMMEIGMGEPEQIITCPFDLPGFSPYVLAAICKKVPNKDIPYWVLNKLKEELIEANEPIRKPWWKLW